MTPTASICVVKRKLLMLILLLGFSSLIYANFEESISVRLTPDSQADFENIISKEDINKEDINKKIGIGNKFIRMWVTNEDTYDPEVEEEWNAKVSPLIEMNGEKWQKYSEKWEPSVSQFLNGRMERGSLLICPQIKIRKIQYSYHILNIQYEATLIGISFDQGTKLNQYIIDSRQRGGPYVVSLEIGRNGRVSAVSSQQTIRAWSIQYYKAGLERALHIDIDQKNTAGAHRIKEHLKSIQTESAFCSSYNKQ